MLRSAKVWKFFDEIQQQEQINNFTTNICLTQ